MQHSSEILYEAADNCSSFWLSRCGTEGASLSPFCGVLVGDCDGDTGSGGTRSRLYRYGRWYGLRRPVVLRRTVRLWAGMAVGRLRWLVSRREQRAG